MRLPSPLRFFLSAMAVTALSGCSHDPIVTAEAAIFGGDAPPAAGETAEAVAWGTPAIITAGFEGPPPSAAYGDGPYLLDTGDRLRVFVYGQPNLSRGYTVDQEGKITVPLIGAVRARGRTTAELEQAIKHRLGAEFVRDPQITVDIQQNRPFFIYGEVKNAGQFPFVSGMTVETAIAIAGGFSERASDRSYRVTRRNGGFIEQIEAPGDFVVQPGDTVFVHERFF